jgi:outer membrane protein TolC
VRLDKTLWQAKAPAPPKVALVALCMSVPMWSQIAQVQGPITPRGRVELEPFQEVQIPARVGVAGQYPLTLQRVIERVMANNPDLQVARITRQEADYNVTAAEGYYDPTVGFEAHRSRAETPIASLIGGSASGRLTQAELAVNPVMNGSSPWWGGSYNLTFANSRTQTDSTFATLNPQYPTSLSLNLTQPLWRGLRIDDARYRLQVARKNTGLSAEQLRQRVIEVVTQAVQYYWELDYAVQNLEVQTQAVRLAEDQRASNRRQADQGILAPIDVVAAQTQVATFEQNLFAAQQALTTAENNLKTLMADGASDPIWNMALAPETPPDLNVIPPTVDEAVKRGLTARPELSENLINREINGLQVQVNREATRPRVDAVATLTSAGLAGAPQALTSFSIPGFSGVSLPPILRGDYGQSLSNLSSGNFATARVGVQVSLPLRNRTAEANLAVAVAEKRKLEVLRSQLEMAIEADVRNALGSVNSARARYDAAIAASRYAQEQYDSEQRQFQAGTSTVFLVLQRQTDFISARSREVRARADLAESLANLDRATARTIDTYQISLTP